MSTPTRFRRRGLEAGFKSLGLSLGHRHRLGSGPGLGPSLSRPD